MKRKQALAAIRTPAAHAHYPPACSLCGRALGARVEYHHRIPKSRGGTETVPVHPICHRTIHACVANHDLAAGFADLATLRTHPEIARFLRWIAGKAPDFHAPTRRARG